MRRALVATMLLGACGEPHVDRNADAGYPNHNAPLGRIEGTLVYEGPPPAVDAAGRPVGRVVFLLFHADAPPPPQGFATTALGVATLRVAALRLAQPLGHTRSRARERGVHLPEHRRRGGLPGPRVLLRAGGRAGLSPHLRRAQPALARGRRGRRAARREPPRARSFSASPWGARARTGPWSSRRRARSPRGSRCSSGARWRPTARCSTSRPWATPSRPRPSSARPPARPSRTGRTAPGCSRPRPRRTR